LKDPVDIEKVSWEFKKMSNGIDGVQIYVDTYDPQKKSFFYFWDYHETWEFWVPYVSISTYLPEMKICYKDVDQRSSILLQSTRDYVDDKVIGFPLYTIGGNTNRLSVRYSTLITQYVLTEKTYEFFKNLKEINENKGSLFDRVPQILVGNMINSLDPDIPVLGNFQVSGASVKRIFIARDELPFSFNVTTEYEFCKMKYQVSPVRQTHLFDSLRGAGWIAIDTFYNYADKDYLYDMVNSRGCFDCTMAGKIKKPVFW
jgi:hypothetical protein